MEIAAEEIKHKANQIGHGKQPSASALLRAIFRLHFYFVTPYGKSNPYGLGEWKVVLL